MTDTVEPRSTFTDRFGQTVGAGDFVVYGTRVGNVAQTRFAMVTEVYVKRTEREPDGAYTDVSVKPLQRAGGEWKYGRTSKPTVGNIVKVSLPESDGIHLV